MADNKKMSIAEILAAARKADGGGGSPPAQPDAEQPATESAPAAESKPAADKPKPAAPASGGKPSVADIMAMARSQDAKGAAKPKPAAKPAAPAAKKPAEKPAAKQPAPAPTGSGEKDTTSILAAARRSNQPGPMSKAEAAARQKSAPAAVDAKKSKPTAPPMPAKPAYAQPKPAAKPAADEDRRTVVGLMFGTFLGIGFTAMSGTFGLWTLGFARFMFPNVLTEPPNQFKVGFTADFAPGTVETKYKAQYGVWVVNAEYNGQQQIVALKSVCTHLGCTPNWLEGEQKFKCPCHGSGFYKDGINFEGPAPRPLERYAIRIADDGQIEIDKSKTFKEEVGQWSDGSSYIPV